MQVTALIFSITPLRFHLTLDTIRTVDDCGVSPDNQAAVFAVLTGIRSLTDAKFVFGREQPPDSVLQLFIGINVPFRLESRIFRQYVYFCIYTGAYVIPNNGCLASN